MAETIPENCEIIAQMVADGKDVERVAAVVTSNVSNEDAQKELTDLGFDSLDVVELGMLAEDCKSCGEKAEGCILGSFLLELVPNE